MNKQLLIFAFFFQDEPYLDRTMCVKSTKCKDTGTSDCIDSCDQLSHISSDQAENITKALEMATMMSTDTTFPACWSGRHGWKPRTTDYWKKVVTRHGHCIISEQGNIVLILLLLLCYIKN